MGRTSKILACQACGRRIATPHRHRVTVMSEGLPSKNCPGKTIPWLDNEFHRTICDECYQRVKDVLGVSE